MLDPDIKREIDQINKNLVDIRKNGGVWKSFFRGVLSGFGSILGVAIALAALTWILNIVGVIPALKNQVNQFQQTLEQIQQSK